MWVRFRGRAPGRPIFRRQHPVGPFILDFYCAAARLAVEIDGECHAFGDRPERDARRESWLRREGIEIVRLAAREVMADPDDAADGVFRLALARLATPRT